MMEVRKGTPANGSILDLMDEGWTIAFSEIFGGSRPESFQFECEGRTWIADDQYCMNPDCRCLDVTLTFLEIVGDVLGNTKPFTVRLSLKNGVFIELDERRGEQPASPLATKVVSGFIEWLGADLKPLKARYKSMKDKGAELRQERMDQSRLHAPPGRNDPCPCGSGKKYKKCCGR